MPSFTVHYLHTYVLYENVIATTEEEAIKLCQNKFHLNVCMDDTDIMRWEAIEQKEKS